MPRPLDPLVRLALGAALGLVVVRPQAAHQPAVHALGPAGPWLWPETVLGIGLDGDKGLIVSLLSPLTDSARMFMALPLPFNRSGVILPLFWGLTLATPGQALLRRLLLGTLLLLPVAFVMVLLYAQFQLALYRTHLPALTETPPADYILALLGVLLLLGCDLQQRQYRVAMQQLFHHDYRAAALTLGSLAENGHAPAQFRLVGMLYRLGLGVPRNPRRAVYWFEKAAGGMVSGTSMAESFRHGEPGFARAGL